MGVIGLIKNRSESETGIDKKASSVLLEDNFEHCCIVGQTGCGKTTSVINPNVEDRIKRGHALLVFDHKGNYHTTVKALANRHGRLEEVVVLGEPLGGRINLIRHMNQRDLEQFLSLVLGHNDRDRFWEHSAISLAIEIWKLLKAYETLIGVDGRRLGADFSQMRYPVTIGSIHDIAKNVRNIHAFGERMREYFYKISDPECKAIDYDKNPTPETKQHIDDHYRFGRAYLEFKKNILENDTYKKRGESDENRTATSILICLTGPLGALASNESLNDPDGETLENLLNSGKIVVMRTNSLSDNAMAAITRSYFDRALKRIGDRKSPPVSVFIDEAQKVLSPHFDLPLDTVREARIDVFLAFQSISLLELAVGEIKSKALLVNMTRRFLFKSSEPTEGVATSGLERFEYYTSLDDYAKSHHAAPFFIEKREIFEAEYAHQRRLGLLDIVPPQERPQECKFILLPDDTRIGNSATIVLENGDSRRVNLWNEEREENVWTMLEKMYRYRKKMDSRENEVEKVELLFQEVYQARI
ncbi:hypothetical protein NNO_1502 [Hydrogenimonas sp.]|nr:hypothetical protein NNO_1502 [Hydrogenimonas sp.]